ncbi:hypothetical protein BN439_1760 [Erwinia amylovora Ea644]|nr:hypothetical protein BN439_1760 [Erwinia amylovora Ea644]CCP06854.1 hypothetical protein BN440_1824 [Erwinia amylovora MR1]
MHCEDNLIDSFHQVSRMQRIEGQQYLPEDKANQQVLLVKH